MVPTDAGRLRKREEIVWLYEKKRKQIFWPERMHLSSTTFTGLQQFGGLEDHVCREILRKEESGGRETLW